MTQMLMGKNKSDNENSMVMKGLLILAIVTIIVLMPTAYASSANASSQATASNGGSATANSQATASNGGNANANSQATATDGGSATANSKATALNGGSATVNSLTDANNGQSITSDADLTASGSSQTMTVVNGVTTTRSETTNSKSNSDKIAKTTSGGTTSYSSTSNRVTTNSVKSVSNQVISSERQIKDSGTIFVGNYKQTNDGRIIKSDEEQVTGYTSSTYRTQAKPKKDVSKGNSPPTVKTNDEKNNVISQILKYLRLN